MGWWQEYESRDVVGTVKFQKMAVMQHIGCKLTLNILEEEVGEEPQLLLELEKDLPYNQVTQMQRKKCMYNPMLLKYVHFTLTM